MLESLYHKNSFWPDSYCTQWWYLKDSEMTAQSGLMKGWPDRTALYCLYSTSTRVIRMDKRAHTGRQADVGTAETSMDHSESNQDLSVYQSRAVDGGPAPCKALRARSLQKIQQILKHTSVRCQMGCWTLPVVPVNCSHTRDTFHHALQQHQQRGKLCKTKEKKRYQGGTIPPEMAVTNTEKLWYDFSAQHLL